MPIIKDNKLEKRYSPIDFGRKISENRNLVILIASLLSIFTIFCLLVLKQYSTELSEDSFITYTGEEFCIEGSFPLSDLYSNSSETFISTFEDSSRFLGVSWYSSKLCFSSDELLKENKSYDFTFGLFGSLFKEEIDVTSGLYPKLKSITISEESFIPINSSIEFQFDKQDNIFDYNIKLGSYTLSCVKSPELQLICNTAELNLVQGAEYVFELQRSFNGEYIESLFSTNVKTGDALVLEEISIKEGEILYDPLTEIILIFNQPIGDIDGIKIINASESGSQPELKLQKKIDNNKVIISLVSEFESNSKYRLELSSATSTTQSFLTRSYNVNFIVSDGPMITSTSSTPSKMLVDSKITIQFDQEINPKQSINSFFKISPAIPTSVYINGDSLIIDPVGQFASCTDYTITILEGFQSILGLGKSAEETIHFKTYCAQVSSIGKSVKGNNIYSYTYGSGSETLILFGAMHGSEKSSGVTLNSLIDRMESRVDEIPSGKKIIIVPILNPDGYNSFKRYNANNVDLNRNFDTTNWTKDSDGPDGSSTSSGGQEPFSEPESRAIRDLILQNSPYLTVSYHAAASYVIANGGIDSNSYAQQYANTSGYRFISSSVEDAFEYTITGNFGAWAFENDFTAIIVELASETRDEIVWNEEAIWKLIY
jgi:hypothetical protein